MKNEHLFTDKAENYRLARPSYAPEAIDKIFKMINPGEFAADIGSGTGIFTREFLRRGIDVYRVEPNMAMSKKAISRFGTDGRFHRVTAPGENTGLKSKSISLITAASSFHWLDLPKFKKECKRILTDNGVVCIIANERVYDDFTLKQDALCKKYCSGYTSLSHGAQKCRERAELFFEGEYYIEEYDFPLEYTKEKFILRSLSSSYSPLVGSNEEKEYKAQLNKLLNETFLWDNIVIQNKTLLIWGKISQK